MYTPNPNAFIGKLFSVISDKKPMTTRDLTKMVCEKYPDFPKKSVSVHLRFLVKKKLISIYRFEGVNYYCRSPINEQQLTSLEHEEEEEEMTTEKKTTVGVRILNYCKDHIGKKIVSSEVRDYFKMNNTGYLNILKRLSDAGAIQSIENTSPREYLVLPDIKALDKVPTKKDLGISKNHSIIQKHEIPLVDIKPTLANMSINDMLTEYVTLKEENIRLRHALQRMATEFIQLGIIEGE